MRYSDQIAADQCGRYKEIILYMDSQCRWGAVTCLCTEHLMRMLDDLHLLVQFVLMEQMYQGEAAVTFTILTVLGEHSQFAAFDKSVHLPSWYCLAPIAIYWQGGRASWLHVSLGCGNLNSLASDQSFLTTV